MKTAPTKAKPTKAPKVKGAKSPVARAQSEMNEALKAEMEEVRKKIDQLTDYDIEVRYEIGHKLNEIKDDSTGKYGADPEKLMYAVMPLGRDSLRPMMTLARVYSQDDVKRLRTARNPQTQERLMWSHVVALVRLKDKNKAFTLAEKAVNAGWSSRELNAEVIRISGGPRSRGGAPRKKVATLEAAVTDVKAESQRWINAADKTWLGEGGLADLYAAAVAEWPAKKPPQSVVDTLESARDILNAMSVKLATVSHQVAVQISQAQAARQARVPVA